MVLLLKKLHGRVYLNLSGLMDTFLQLNTFLKIIFDKEIVAMIASAQQDVRPALALQWFDHILQNAMNFLKLHLQQDPHLPELGGWLVNLKSVVSKLGRCVMMFQQERFVLVILQLHLTVSLHLVPGFLHLPLRMDVL